MDGTFVDLMDDGGNHLWQLFESSVLKKPL